MIVCSAQRVSGTIAFAAQRDRRRLAFEAGGFDLHLEAHEVVDKHDVVDEHVGQLDVARRLVAAQADGE